MTFPLWWQYADPVSDLLDKWGAFRCRLFRESCVFHRGNYVKDLSRLGRDLNKVIIVDNSPASYVFHPDNAVSVPLKDSNWVVKLFWVGWKVVGLLLFQKNKIWDVQNLDNRLYTSPTVTFGPLGHNFYFCPGSRCLVVRRHVWHRATGPHPFLREAEQSRQRLHGPQAPRDCELTALDLSPQLRTKRKKTNDVHRSKCTHQRGFQLSLPARTPTAPRLPKPFTLPRSRLEEWAFSDSIRIITATFWPNRKTAWNLPCSCSPYQPPVNQLMRVNGWMNVLRTLMRCRRTCRRVMKADICTHESSGCRPGTGQRLQQPDLAEDAGCWNRESSGKEFLFLFSFFFRRGINLISLVLERADGVNCMYCIWNGLYQTPRLYFLPFVPAVKNESSKPTLPF